MVLVIGDFALHEGCTRCFAVVREIEEVYHVRLLPQHGLPAEVNNALEAEGFMVLFPTMPDKNGVRLRKRFKLKFCDV